MKRTKRNKVIGSSALILAAIVMLGAFLYAAFSDTDSNRFSFLTERRSEITIVQQNPEIAVGDKLALEAQLADLTAGTKDLTWSSSDETIATVDQYGVVTGVKSGRSTITVETEDGAAATTELLVYIPITNEAELQAVDGHIQSGDANAVFRVMNDIDMSTDTTMTDFNPIDGFAATFEGQGFTISNYNSTTNGLFASTTVDAVIDNVHIDGTVTNTTDNTGLLVGTNAGTVENSSSSGTVSGSNFTGGLVGFTEAGSSVTNSYSSANASSSVNGTGALVGHSQGTISNCYATGTSSSGGWTAGGLVGWANTGTVITNCYATGDATTATITPDSGNAGGLVGYLAGTVTNSYATGNATCTSGTNAGGLVGYIETGTISNSYATGSVTAAGYTYGLVGNNFGGVTITNSYAYEDQSVNGTLVGEDETLAGTGTSNNVATHANISSTTWYQNTLQLGTSFKYEDGKYPQVYLSGSTTDLVPEQTLTDIPESLVIHITNADELQAVSSDPRRSNPNATFIVDNDIDCTSITDFQPITGFAATFEGQGFTISNYNSTANGLFATTTSTAVIDDVHIEGTVTSTGTSVGLLVGSNSGTIANSSSAGAVEGTAQVGGLVGLHQASAVIENSYSTANVEGGDDTGGLVGQMNGSAPIITNSYATGSVTGKLRVGGLVGFYISGDINYSYSTGDVFGEAQVGGLIGQQNGGNINSCYTTSKTTATGANVGGMIGYLYAGTISDCYATGDVNSQIGSNMTGFIGYLDGNGGFSITNCYAYELQSINGSFVSSNPATLAGTGATPSVATYGQLCDATWQTTLLGGQFTCTSGYYPKVLSTTGTEVPGQTGIAIDNVIEITTATQLQGIDTHSASAKGDGSNITYKVMNDIDCSSIADFNSIDGFGATFNGQGYSITGYNSTQNGLFANTTGTAVIDNVNTNGNVNVSGAGDGIGLLVGSNSGLVTNSSVTGAINASSSNNTGGLVGTNYGTTTNSYSSADVNGFTHAGGLVGWNQAIINNCYSTGDVTTGTSTSASTSAGLVGMNYMGATISNCYATGNVEGFHHVGGLVGQNYAEINNSYATGNVTGTGANTGGFVGYHGGGAVTNSYATGNVTGSGATGFAGTIVGTITNSYAYENQVVNGVTVGTNNNLAGTGTTPAVMSYANLNDSVWQSTVLGVGYEYTAGSYPLVYKSGTIELVPGQISVPMNVFEITNSQELQAVESHTQKANPSFTFKVMNDIAIPNGTNFNSINGFGAIFDGQGYSISNYYSTIGGLFMSSSGTIKNVNLQGTVTCNPGSSDTGMLVDYNAGLVTNVTVSGSISQSDIGYAVGGIAGNNGGTITNSYSNCNMSGSYIGGIVGWNTGSVSNCYATGDINGVQEAGGLVGRHAAGSITNCYATGNINASGSAGGLVGYVVGGTITNSFSYEGQYVNGTPVISNPGLAGSGVGVVTYSNLMDPTWQQNLLGNAFDYTTNPGCYPLVLDSNTGQIINGQTVTAIAPVVGIYTPADLAAVGSDPKRNDPNATFIVMQPIDLTGYTIYPIDSFAATFDG